MRGGLLIEKEHLGEDDLKKSDHGSEYEEFDEVL